MGNMVGDLYCIYCGYVILGDSNLKKLRTSGVNKIIDLIEAFKTIYN